MLAAGPDHHTKSGVIEAALRAYLEGNAQQTVLEQVHRRLDTLTQAVKEFTQHLAQPMPVPKALEDRLEMLERQQRQRRPISTGSWRASMPISRRSPMPSRAAWSPRVRAGLVARRGLSRRAEPPVGELEGEPRIAHGDKDFQQ